MQGKIVFPVPLYLFPYSFILLINSPNDVNSETPIRDNLRHPENSFGPGVENNGTRMSVESGVASNTVRGGVSNFSPEFAQNGGEFMEGISASDAFMTDNYSSI